MDANAARFIRRLTEDEELMEIGRRAIEDALVEWRDARRFENARNNGLVIRETDGRQSSLVRFGPETGVKIALRAIAEYIEH